VARLVLVSDGIAAVQHAKLARTGLRGLFEHVVLSAEVGYRKPDPALLGHALARAGTARGAALMVGDSPGTDGAAAAAAGVDFCWVDRRGRPAGVPAPRAGQGPEPEPAQLGSRFRVPDLTALAACLTGRARWRGRPGLAALPRTR
jgi:FMN phosphatase YigB (HAD superfamily)